VTLYDVTVTIPVEVPEHVADDELEQFIEEALCEAIGSQTPYELDDYLRRHIPGAADDV
jgi:hypothetical protein